MKKILILSLMLVLFSSAVVGFSFGGPTPVDNYGFENGVMTSYYGLEFEVETNGVLTVNDDRFFAFALKGTIGGTEYLYTSMDFDWAWSTNHSGDTYQFIGEANQGNFIWRQYYTFYNDGREMKIEHELINNLAQDITGMQMYYIATIEENDVLEYNETKYAMDMISEDVYRQGNFNEITPKIIFHGPDYMFNFQDLVDTGFDINEVYLGNGSIIEYPELQILAVGFTKGDGALGVGQSVLVDPTVQFATTVIETIILETITENSFILGWCDETADDVTYAVYWTNGTVKYAARDINAAVGGCPGMQGIDVKLINETTALFAYTIIGVDDHYAVIFDIATGTVLNTETILDTDAGSDCHALLSFNNTYWAWVIHKYHASGTTSDLYVSTWDFSTQIDDTTVDADTDLLIRCSASAINESAYIVMWEAAANDLDYQVRDIQGNVLQATTTIDDDAEESEIIYMGNKLFVAVYEDRGANTLSYEVLYLNGTQYLAKTSIDATISNVWDAKIAWLNSTAFKVFYDDDLSDNFTYSVWDIEGNNLIAQVLFAGPTPAPNAVAIASDSYYNGIAHCSENTVIAYEFSSTVSNFTTIQLDGTAWDGSCNAAPTVTASATAPATVYTNTDTILNITCTDTDGGDTITAYYQTYLNDAYNEYGGSVVTSATNTELFVFGSGNYSKTDEIIFEITCGDGTVNATAENTTLITVANGIPTIGNPTLDTLVPQTDDILTCTGQTFSDIDAGDSATWYYKWYDGGVLIASQESSTLDLGVAGLNKADTIKCSTIASDGTANATAWTNSTEATIQNTIPVIGSPTIDDATPQTDDTITMTNGSYADDDADASTWYYRWWKQEAGVGDFALISGETANTIDLACAGCDKTDVIKGSTIADDGEDNATAWTNATTSTIQNTIPTIGNPTINDYTPGTADTITCTGTSYADDDSDAATWYYRWWQDNLGLGTYAIITGEATATLDLTGAGLDKTDEIKCETIASDGEANATAWTNSSVATIGNAAPTITSAKLWITDLGGTPEVKLNITAADADGLADLAFANYSTTEGAFGGVGTITLDIGDTLTQNQVIWVNDSDDGQVSLTVNFAITAGTLAQNTTFSATLDNQSTQLNSTVVNNDGSASFDYDITHALDTGATAFGSTEQFTGTLAASGTTYLYSWRYGDWVTLTTGDWEQDTTETTEAGGTTYITKEEDIFNNNTVVTFAATDLELANRSTWTCDPQLTADLTNNDWTNITQANNCTKAVVIAKTITLENIDAIYYINETTSVNVSSLVNNTDASINFTNILVNLSGDFPDGDLTRWTNTTYPWFTDVNLTFGQTTTKKVTVTGINADKLSVTDYGACPTGYTSFGTYCKKVTDTLGGGKHYYFEYYVNVTSNATKGGKMELQTNLATYTDWTLKSSVNYAVNGSAVDLTLPENAVNVNISVGTSHSTSSLSTGIYVFGIDYLVGSATAGGGGGGGGTPLTPVLDITTGENVSKAFEIVDLNDKVITVLPFQTKLDEFRITNLLPTDINITAMPDISTPGCEYFNFRAGDEVYPAFTGKIIESRSGVSGGFEFISYEVRANTNVTGRYGCIYHFSTPDYSEQVVFTIDVVDSLGFSTVWTFLTRPVFDGEICAGWAGIKSLFSDYECEATDYKSISWFTNIYWVILLILIPTLYIFSGLLVRFKNWAFGKSNKNTPLLNPAFKRQF